jgi:phosphoserine phosphatase
VAHSRARAALSEPIAAGQDVFIVGSSGQEMVASIGVLLDGSAVIATRMQAAAGRYTGILVFYAYGEAKAIRMREPAAERAGDAPPGSSARPRELADVGIRRK